MYLAKAIIATVGIAVVTFCAVIVLPMRSYNALVSAGADPKTASTMAINGGGLRTLVALLGGWLFMCLLYSGPRDATVRFAMWMIGR